MQIRETTSQLYDKIEAIRRGASELKRTLPAICWAAEFTDGHRHKESATPTGLAFLDIDHVFSLDNSTTTPQTFYNKYLGGREAALGIVHAQVSPSGDGLHIVFIPTNGGSMEEAQSSFASLAGLPGYDAQCKDLSRMLFLSTLSDTLFDALDILVDD